MQIIYEATRKIMQEAAQLARQLATQTIVPTYKSDGSPVTTIDMAVNAFLKARLLALPLRANWLSEEEPPPDFIHAYTWVVDPIDGTRAMIKGFEEWGISLALLHHARPMMGLIACPPREVLYHALTGQGAFLDETRLHELPVLRLQGAKLSGPLPIIKPFEARGVQLMPRIPSLALRLVYVSENKLQAAFASENAHDWDIAAADIIVQEAGGKLWDAKKNAPLYLKPPFKQPALIATHESLFDLIA